MTKEEKLARKQQRKAEKVGLGKLLLWNSSSCSVALSTLMLGYATFYCTDVLQLAPALVGTLFMVSKIFDSFTDVVAGFIVDRTQTRWGKGRPYEIFMLFLWLSTWLLFSCPTSFATAAKCVWIFCMYTFMNSICVTFLNANNVVYMVRAFENKEQQSKIVGYGSIFTMAGAMVFNVLFPTAMAKVGTDAVGWSRLVGMIAMCSTIATRIAACSAVKAWWNRLKFCRTGVSRRWKSQQADRTALPCRLSNCVNCPPMPPVTCI